MLPLAHIDHQGRAIDLRRLPDQVGKCRDQLQRHVVDRVKTEIFKCLERGGFAGSGKAGQDDQFRSHRGHHCSRLLGGLSVDLGFGLASAWHGAIVAFNA